MSHVPRLLDAAAAGEHPFCVGEARRVVLAQLTWHYQRPFADQWEFVDYVHQQRLELDLTTPRKRPRQLP